MMMFGRSKPSPFDAPDEWDILEGTHNGGPMIVRLRSGLRASAGHKDFGIQIGVAVPLKDPSSNGLPTTGEDHQLGTIEARLSRDLESSGRAVLAAVITTSGMREFVFYSGSKDWIQDWANGLQATTDTHQIQVLSQSDPKWSVYRSLAPSD
jgi:Family of unknown function (DUF695)